MPSRAAGPHDAASRWSAAVVGARPARRRALPRHEAGDVEVPYTMLAGREVIETDTHWAEHSHPTHELLWNEHGASTARVGARVHTISPGVGLWVPAGVPHSGFTPAGVRHLAAQFSIIRMRPPAHEAVAVEITPLLQLLLERSLADGLAPRSRELTDAMILDLLAPSPRELPLTVPDHPLLAPVVEALTADPADPTTLEEWARRLGVSSRTLTRAFEASTGRGFRAWAATARAQRAVALLAAGLRIEDVAAQVGYSSASAFTAAFRRVTGMTPSIYRGAGLAPAPAVPPPAPAASAS